ncbi:hypothetical protein LWF01_15735 [Saxibacter everestensis]|uniref:DUF3040 domain-containing protein n=1 Tax=Saxibacter everestensis TaxID=2909229 RepID=A0ABY8QRH4_9MICO|nr:hypothetical protein LWF01_15735 [Brevibacteriaceae bacterium ZFBP1038]
MDAERFERELERRVALLEDADSGEAILPPLPARDLWLAVAGLVVISVFMIWWGYLG